jgi:hypothetical protein
LSKTQFISFGNEGFWAYDVALGIFLKHVIDAAEASDHANTVWLSSETDSWRDVACNSDYGLTLDPEWLAEQRQTFIVLAEEACTTLGTRRSIAAEEIIAWSIPDDLRIFPRGATEILTDPIVELGRATIALVSGDLPEAPLGQAWLYGTEDGRLTIGFRRF